MQAFLVSGFLSMMFSNVNLCPQAEEVPQSAPPKSKARPGLHRLKSEGSAKLLLDISAEAERSASSQDESRTQQVADLEHAKSICLDHYL